MTPYERNNLLANLNQQRYAATQQSYDWNNKLNEWGKQAYNFNDLSKFANLGGNPQDISSLNNFGVGLRDLASGIYGTEGYDAGDGAQRNKSIYDSLGLTNNALVNWRGRDALYSQYENDPNKLTEYATKLAADKNYNPFAVDYGALEKQYQPLFQAYAQNTKSLDEFANQQRELFKSQLATNDAAGEKIKSQMVAAPDQAAKALAEAQSKINNQYDVGSKSLNDWLNTNQTKINTGIDTQLNSSLGKLTENYNTNKAKLDDWLTTNQAKYGKDPRLQTAYDTQLKTLNDKIAEVKTNINNQYGSVRQKQLDALQTPYQKQLAQLNEGKSKALSNSQNVSDQQLNNFLKQLNDQRTSLNASYDTNYSNIASAMNNAINGIFGGVAPKSMAPAVAPAAPTKQTIDPAKFKQFVIANKLAKPKSQAELNSYYQQFLKTQK
jgi:hypothetical protein